MSNAKECDFHQQKLSGIGVSDETATSPSLTITAGIFFIIFNKNKNFDEETHNRINYYEGKIMQI